MNRRDQHDKNRSAAYGDFTGSDLDEILSQLPELTDLRLHYINSKEFRDRADCEYPLADAKAALVVNHMQRPLKVLELKHCFAVKDVSIHLLQPQPELVKLELDTTFAGPEAVSN